MKWGWINDFLNGGGVFRGGSRLSSIGEMIGVDQGFHQMVKWGRINDFLKGEGGINRGGSRILPKGKKKRGSPITGANQLILQ